jgi:hypothetical protein
MKSVRQLKDEDVHPSWCLRQRLKSAKSKGRACELRLIDISRAIVGKAKWFKKLQPDRVPFTLRNDYYTTQCFT